jgi:putative DNA primase/helicase
MTTQTQDPFAAHMSAVARALFGDPNAQHSKPGKPRWGSKGSLAIDEVRGVWFDHENQIGGGVLDLIAREKSVSGPDAIEWLKSIGCAVNGASKTNGAGKSANSLERKLLETYDYLDFDGTLVLQVRRVGFIENAKLKMTVAGKPEKTFQQRRPDPDNPKAWIWGIRAGEYMRKAPGQDWYPFNEERWERLPATRERQTFPAAKIIPYRAPELIEAIAVDYPVFVVEGEQKVDALAKWNLRATCNAQGAGKWTAEHTEYLKDADAIVIPDNDAAGRKHAEQVARSLIGVASRVRVLELPGLKVKGDIIDWQKAGHTREKLDALIRQATVWAGQAKQQLQGDARGLILHRASDINPEPVEWLWPSRIALGKQTLLAGEAGLGKSQAAIDVAAKVTTAGDWPCGEGKAPLGSALFLCAEDGLADTIVPRLMAAGANLDRVHIVSAVQNEDGKGRRAFNLQADLDLLERKIAELGDVRLIVIDPISSYMGPKLDSHVNAAVRGVLEPVGELATRLRVAIVSITHPPKGTGTTAINRFIGSVAFVAAARSAFMVTRDPDDVSRRLFLPVKNNLAPLSTGLAFRLEQRIVGPEDKGIVASAVAWDPNPVNILADEALRAVDSGDGDDRATLKDDAIEFLRIVLASGPLKVAEIEREARDARLLSGNQDISQAKPFRAARKALNVITTKGGMADGWIWSLPKMT